MKYTTFIKKLDLSSESLRMGLRRALPLFSVAVLAASLAVPERTNAETISVRIADGSDDAEENPGGGIDLGSSDLEIGAQGGGSDAQLIGMRFLDIDIPRGAAITSANIQFTVDETDDEVQTTPIQIYGELGDALRFAATNDNISARTRTSNFVDWEDIPPWATEGEAGPDQLTPDIAAVIQSIVNQGSWAPNNALVIIMSEHANFERTAESFNGTPDAAALLTIDFDPSQLILFGDFNNDGAIDLNDFQILAANFHIGTNHAEGDFTSDGTVDLRDFVGFRKAFEQAPAAAGAAAVPEPQSMVLVIVGLAGMATCRRRRSRR